jgi:diacylglycerol O-acyltransferase / wax synthase
LIHGLASGRIAVYLKVHHATIDGVSGNDLIAALMDLTPSGREIEAPPVRADDRVPGALELLARSSLSLAAHPKRVRIGYRLARSAPAIVSRPARRRLPIVNRLGGGDEDVVLPRSGRLRAPATPFNGGVSAHRRWTFRSLPFDDVKAVKDAYGATVNDVVMALCAGALRGWLEKHDALPDVPLVAAVPVSIRVPGDDHSGNKISMMIAPIPTDIADAGERVRVAHEAMRAAKEVHGALPANLHADVAQFAMPALVNRLPACRPDSDCSNGPARST